MPFRSASGISPPHEAAQRWKIHTSQIGQHGQDAGEIVAARPGAFGDPHRDAGAEGGSYAIFRILDGEAIRARQAEFTKHPVADVGRRLLGGGLRAGADHLEAAGRQVGKRGGEQHIDVGA